MELLLVTVIFIGIFIFVLIAMNKSDEPKKHDKPKTNKTAIKPSHLMTTHEKVMFGLLKEAVPECHIFVQVALGGILWTSSYATRNKFSQKIADFVITDQNFTILAVIELDDKSHIGKEEKDAERDAMVREAGYKALRYPAIPPKNQLRSDILFQS